MDEAGPSAGDPVVEDLNGAALLTCAMCNRSFRTMAELDNHLDNEHNPFSADSLMGCGLCGELFTLVEYLDEHILKVHGQNHLQNIQNGDASEGLYVCINCELRFNHIVDLTAHMKTHDTENAVTIDTGSKENDHNMSFQGDTDLETFMLNDDGEITSDYRVAGSVVPPEINYENGAYNSSENKRTPMLSAASAISPMPLEIPMPRSANSFTESPLARCTSMSPIVNCAALVENDKALDCEKTTDNQGISCLPVLTSVTSLAGELEGSEKLENAAKEVEPVEAAKDGLPTTSADAVAAANVYQPVVEKERADELPEIEDWPFDIIPKRRKRKERSAWPPSKWGTTPFPRKNRDRDNRNLCIDAIAKKPVTKEDIEKEPELTKIAMMFDEMPINDSLKKKYPAPASIWKTIELPSRRPLHKARLDGLDVMAIKFNPNYFSTDCDLCKKRFSSVREVRRHKSAVHPSQAHLCGICQETFSNLELLYNHLANTHQDIHKGLKLKMAQDKAKARSEVKLPDLPQTRGKRRQSVQSQVPSNFRATKKEPKAQAGVTNSVTGIHKIPKPGQERESEIKPGNLRENETKPDHLKENETNQGHLEENETKPGLERESEIKPGHESESENKPGHERERETKPGHQRESETADSAPCSATCEVSYEAFKATLLPERPHTESESSSAPRINPKRNNYIFKMIKNQKARNQSYSRGSVYQSNFRARPRGRPFKGRRRGVKRKRKLLHDEIERDRLLEAMRREKYGRVLVNARGLVTTYPCRYCDLTFTVLKTYDEHLLSVHLSPIPKRTKGAKLQKMSCDACNLDFEGSILYRAHLRMVHNIGKGQELHKIKVPKDLVFPEEKKYQPLRNYREKIEIDEIPEESPEYCDGRFVRMTYSYDASPSTSSAVKSESISTDEPGCSDDDPESMNVKVEREVIQVKIERDSVPVKSVQVCLERLQSYPCHRCTAEFFCRSKLRRHLDNHPYIKTLKTSESEEGVSPPSRPLTVSPLESLEAGPTEQSAALGETKEKVMAEVKNEQGESVELKRKKKQMRLEYLKRRPINLCRIPRRDCHQIYEVGDGVQCPACQKIFVKKSHLDEHVWVHFKKLPWRCRYCERGFRRESHLAVHIDSQHLEEQLEEVNRHSLDPTVKARTHRPFQCELCNDIFRRKCELEMHLLVHLKEMHLKCYPCDISFETVISLNKHVKKYHSQPNKRSQRETKEVNYRDGETSDESHDDADSDYFVNNDIENVGKGAVEDASGSETTDDSESDADTNQKPFENIKPEAIGKPNVEPQTTAKEAPPSVQVGESEHLSLVSRVQNALDEASMNVSKDTSTNTPTNAPVNVSVDSSMTEPMNAAINKRMEEQSPGDITNTSDVICTDVSYDVGKELVYSCKVCEKKFATVKKLDQHLWEHGMRKPLKCHLCGEIFLLNGKLAAHILTHDMASIKATPLKEGSVDSEATWSGTEETESQVVDLEGSQTNKSSNNNLNNEFRQQEPLVHGGDVDVVPGTTSTRAVVPESIPAPAKTEAASDPFPIVINTQSLSSSGYCNLEVLPGPSHMLSPTWRSDASRSYYDTIYRDRTLYPHLCTICQKRFQSSNHLNEHIWIHLSQRPYQCDVCPKEFTRRRNKLLHMSKHNGVDFEVDSFSRCRKRKKNSKYTCVYCGRFYKVPGLLLKHLPSHFNNCTHTCKYCHKVYNLELKFQKHILHHDKELGLLKCVPNAGVTLNRNLLSLQDGDEQSFDNDNVQSVHRTNLQSSHNTKSSVQYALTTDGAQVPAKRSGRHKHDMSYSLERPHLCIACGKAFKTKWHLNEHAMTHLTVKPFSCRICNRGFLRRNVFRAHMERHSHTIHRKKQVRGKRTESSAALSTRDSTPDVSTITVQVAGHPNEHNVELQVKQEFMSVGRNKQCHVCWKVMSCTEELTDHMWIHCNKPQPLKCPYCFRNFKEESILAEHMKKHLKGRNKMKWKKQEVQKEDTAGKMKHCKFCKKKFKFKSQLEEHIWVHYTDKRFKCNICVRGFNRKRCLLKHLASEHEVYSLKYNITPADLNDIHNMNELGVVQDSGKEDAIQLSEKDDAMSANEQQHFKCYVCGEVFYDKDDVVLHLSTHSEHYQLDTNTTFPNLNSALSFPPIAEDGSIDDVANMTRSTSPGVMLEQDSMDMLNPMQTSIPPSETIPSLQSPMTNIHEEAIIPEPGGMFYEDQDVMFIPDKHHGQNEGPFIEIDQGIDPVIELDRDVIDHEHISTPITSSVNYGPPNDDPDPFQKVISIDINSDNDLDDDDLHNNDLHNNDLDPDHDENTTVLDIFPQPDMEDVNYETENRFHGVRAIQITPTTSDNGVIGQIIIKPEYV